MKSRFFFGVIILLTVIIFAGFWFKKNKMETTKICFNEHCLTAEVARARAEREKGLMFRQSLALDGAMLFVFEQPGVYNFWMKNCLIPLDIIWLDENYKVVAIKPNNQPCPATGECVSINPNAVAKYALEINAGLVSQIGLVEGNYSTPFK